MSRTIAHNAQDYLKLTPSLFHINKRNKCVHETVELYWEELKKNGFKTFFCGHGISIPLKSDNLPQIKWVDIADAEGDYNAETHTIYLKKSLLHTPQDLYKTVIHELTHAAQNEIVKQITDYTPNQAEYHLLKLLTAEMNTIPNAGYTIGPIDIGNRIYVSPCCNWKPDVNISRYHLVDNIERFYQLIENEREARCAEISWAQQSGIFTDKDIAAMHKQQADQLEAVQNHFFVEYLDNDTVLSVVQCAQLDILNGRFPGKILVAEADIAYELACTISVLNNEMTHTQYNQNVAMNTKRHVMPQYNCFVNLGKERLGTLPIESAKEVPTAQNPRELIYELCANQNFASQLTEEHWVAMFTLVHSSEIAAPYYLERLQEVLGQNFDQYKKQYYDNAQQKITQSTQEAKAHYSTVKQFPYEQTPTPKNPNNASNIKLEYQEIERQ